MFSHCRTVSCVFILQDSQLEKLKMTTSFSSAELSQGAVPGIRTAFTECSEDKRGLQTFIEIDPKIQGRVFGHVLQFLYTGL